jgi:hypothetical protein
MNNSKLKSVALVVLVLINLVLLSFILKNNHHAKDTQFKHKHQQPKDFIIQKLNFDDNQISLYEIEIQKHRSEISRLEDQIKSSKQLLYSLLKTNNSIKSDSLIEDLAALQKKIEITHFDHFLKIKSICKPNQRNDFEELTTELSKLFSKEHPKPKHD